MLMLESGRTRATIAPEYGGRIAQLEIEDRRSWLPLLYTPDDVPLAERDPMGWGCFPMAPWPNRITNATFRFEGAAYTVLANEPPHALHGLGIGATWRIEEITDASCMMSLAFADAWPFGGRALQRITLRNDGIDLTIELHADARTYPAGAGWHPWFRRDVRGGSDVVITVDADDVYELDAMAPTGRLLPVDSERDLRSGARISDRRLDDCYHCPRGELRIAWGDLSLTMRNSQNVTHAVVYTPAQAVCVEPQTCAIDAFNLTSRGIAHAGTAIVTPAAPLVARTSWRWSIG